MNKMSFFVAAVLLLVSIPASACETVTIVYQNDLHGWIFPSSTRIGMNRISRILEPIFKNEPSSFYAVSGDLFTGPNLPTELRAVSELSIWNQFWKQLADQGFGDRVLISAGNHEFDYGVPAIDGFSSGLLCANLMTVENQPHFVPFRVKRTAEGLRAGFIGLLLEEDWRVLGMIAKEHLKMSPMLTAIKRVLPEMGKLDLTILMIHDHVANISRLAETLPSELGVDMILSGHDHYIFEDPLKVNGIYIFQAGAMNNCYGRADLIVDSGKIVSLENQIVELKVTPLERAMMLVKEKVDELNGKTVAVLKQPLLGTYLRDRENSLGDFVTDAYRWAAKTDVAMTNGASLRMDCPVPPGESYDLKEGHFKAITPFGNHLMVGEVTGAQILEILEGEAVNFRNQVSGLAYKMDRHRPEGNRILDARIGGVPVSLNSVYTLTHNSYCTHPKNMEKYLHLKPGSIKWKATDLVDYEVLAKYARHLEVIEYPMETRDRIVIVP